MREFKPLFSKEFYSPDYETPKIIIIEDRVPKTMRKYFRNAVGWRTSGKGLEVLHLYEKAAKESNLSFLQGAHIKSAYIVDPHDQKRYIPINKYIDISKEEQMVELRMIARKLGAKECRLELEKAQKTNIAVGANTKGSLKIETPKIPKIGKINAEATGQEDAKSNVDYFRENHVIFYQSFIGCGEPERPELVWFEGNKEMLEMIEGRLDKKHQLSEYKVEIKSTTDMGISLQLAKSIDLGLMAAGYKTNFSLCAALKKVKHERFFYYVIF